MEDFTEEEFDNLIKELLENDDDQEGWEEVKKVDKKYKITLWMKENGREVHERTKWMKNCAIFPIRFKTMVQLYTKEGKEMVKHHKMIKGHKKFVFDGNTDVIFFVMKMGMPLMSNRYSLIRRRWRQNENKSFYIGERTIPKGDFDLPKLKKKDVLMRVLTVRKYEPVEGDENSTKVTTYGVNNMGGNLAKLEKVFKAMGGMGMFVKMIQKEIDMWVKVGKIVEARMKDEAAESEEEEGEEGEEEEESSEEDEEEDEDEQ